MKYGLRKPRSLTKAAAAARALVFGLVERLRWIRVAPEALAAIFSICRPVVQRGAGLSAAA